MATYSALTVIKRISHEAIECRTYHCWTVFIIISCSRYLNRSGNRTRKTTDTGTKNICITPNFIPSDKVILSIKGRCNVSLIIRGSGNRYITPV